MSHFVFLSLAKHQGQYFQQLLEHTDLTGKVVEPGDMPWPRLGQITGVMGRICWQRLIDEKCQERKVKGKYVGGLYRLLLRLELLWIALRVQALLTREQPTAVIMWNGSHRYCQIMKSLLPSACKTFYVENGLLPNTTTLDAQGVNFHNSVPRDAAFYRHLKTLPDAPAPVAVTLIPRKIKPRNQDLQPVDLPEKYVFIPFQDDRDSQVRLFSPWVGNMAELFALGERLHAELGLTVVFKEHPSSREQYPELHKRTHAKLLFANGNNTQTLIEQSQFVVTLNSTVGLESLLLGKPLITLGQAFFNIDGVVMHADSAEALVNIAAQFPDWPIDPELQQAFLTYLKDVYCVPGRWQDAQPEHLQEVARRMRVED